MQLPPVATTTVGSFPRPAWLAKSERTQVKFHWHGEALKEAQDDATRLILQTQQQIGLDLLTDGEQRRIGFIHHILAAFEGIDVENQAVKKIYRRREQEHLVPRITGKVKRRGSVNVEDLRFAKLQTSKPIKMAVPGPMTVIDSTLDETYNDEPALAMDIAAAIQSVLETALMHVLRIHQRNTGHQNVCLAGGVALNCVGNGRILREGPFKGLWIQPSAGDAGGAIGADEACAVARRIFRQAAHRDHGVKQGHVGAIGDRSGLFGRTDDADLLAEGAGELVDDHRHQRLGDVLREVQADVLGQHRRGLAHGGHVGDQRRGDAPVGADLDFGAELVVAPDELEGRADLHRHVARRRYKFGLQPLPIFVVAGFAWRFGALPAFTIGVF